MQIYDTRFSLRQTFNNDVIGAPGFIPGSKGRTQYPGVWVRVQGGDLGQLHQNPEAMFCRGAGKTSRDESTVKLRFHDYVFFL